MTETGPETSRADVVRLEHPAGAVATIHRRGGHVLSWTPAGGTEALFLGRAAVFAPGAPIRGGIPVVFPQFAEKGPLPKHGFARTREWEPLDRAAGRGSEPSRASFRLRDDEATRDLWPHAFELVLTAELAARALTVRLDVRNTGRAPFTFTAALHTYLRTADVRRTTVEGLRGVPFRDRTSLPADAARPDPDAEVSVGGEVDRLYLGAPREVRVHDRAGGRSIRVGCEGFEDTVVWNPWRELAARLPDLEDDEYLEMICVEAAQVGNPVALAPDEAWRGAQTLELA